MEKKISIIEVIKNEEVTKYIAKDGIEFDSSRECIEYEDKLEANEKIKDIRKVQSDFMDYGEWWHIETEEDLEALKFYLRYVVHRGSLTIAGGEVGTWVSWSIIFWDNAPNECIIVSLKSIQNEYNNLMQAIK
ncbi:MAG: hypothetical protein K0R54_754 [Clostridiaceae bacterium]|nr:hypothetical protein [Clostridiaceae bacterium]